MASVALPASMFPVVSATTAEVGCVARACPQPARKASRGGFPVGSPLRLNAHSRQGTDRRVLRGGARRVDVTAFSRKHSSGESAGKPSEGEPASSEAQDKKQEPQEGKHDDTPHAGAHKQKSEGKADEGEPKQEGKGEGKEQDSKKKHHSMEGFKVLVAGASGRTGREIVRQLRAEGATVVALVRNAVKARSLLPPDTAVVEADVYNYQAVARAFGDCNAVICATGAASFTDLTAPFKVDYEGTRNLVALAKRAGVKQFVLVTSIGVSQLLSPFNLFGGILFWKKQAEEDLQRSGVPYTIVRPGGLKSELRNGEKVRNANEGGETVAERRGGPSSHFCMSLAEQEEGQGAAQRREGEGRGDPFDTQAAG
eukprot:jgi/Mesvir1/19705/Mv09968-RA.2